MLRIYFTSFLCTPQIREVWNSYELDLVNYQNKCRLIRGWDDLFNKVKEHINSVSAMKLSPYYKVDFIYLFFFKAIFNRVACFDCPY